MSDMATMVAMSDICIVRYEAFGTAGSASKIKPMNLVRMYELYDTGSLNPKVK